MKTFTFLLLEKLIDHGSGLLEPGKEIRSTFQSTHPFVARAFGIRLPSQMPELFPDMYLSGCGFTSFHGGVGPL